MVSLFEKVIMDSRYVSRVLVILDYMMLVVKNYLEYFLQDELDSTSPIKPLTRVLTVVLKLCLNILVEK